MYLYLFISAAREQIIILRNKSGSDNVDIISKIAMDVSGTEYTKYKYLREFLLMDVYVRVCITSKLAVLNILINNMGSGIN